MRPAKSPSAGGAGARREIHSGRNEPASNSRTKTQRQAQAALPPNWDRMSVGALWNALNDRTRFATPQSTIDALMYCVGERGLAALEEPDNKERLSRCDDAAREQIKRRIAKLREQGALP